MYYFLIKYYCQQGRDVSHIVLFNHDPDWFSGLIIFSPTVRKSEHAQNVTHLFFNSELSSERQNSAPQSTAQQSTVQPAQYRAAHYSTTWSLLVLSTHIQPASLVREAHVRLLASSLKTGIAGRGASRESACKAERGWSGGLIKGGIKWRFSRSWVSTQE